MIELITYISMDDVTLTMATKFKVAAIFWGLHVVGAFAGFGDFFKPTLLVFVF